MFVQALLFEGQGHGSRQISGVQQSILGARLCRVQQIAIRVINSADAVDRLLIFLDIPGFHAWQPPCQLIFLVLPTYIHCQVSTLSHAVK